MAEIQTTEYLFAINFNVSDVVLKYGGDVDLWELVLAEDDEEAGLPTRAVSNYHQLLSDCRHLEATKIYL